MRMSKLVTIFSLSELTGLSVRSLRTLVRKRVIPFIKLGHRTLLFSPDKVERALERCTVKEVA
jgi:excisionase family DNA binding protein